MATELGKAYVQIVPSAKGIGAMLATEVGGASVSAGALAGKKFGTALIGALGALGIGKMLKDTLTTGMDFDKAMSQVAATMGKSMTEISQQIETVNLSWGTFTGNLREYAREIGAKTIYTAQEAAEALNYMALAGYDVKTSMEMLPNVLHLAAAGNFDLAKASDMVTDTQTAFGLSIERTTQMVDEMAKAASTGNTSVEQLGDAFLVVGGLAQELNGGLVTLANGTTAEVDNIQELEIALTAMANAGVKGSEAGTHMRNVLLKLASPTSEGTKQLNKLGISVFDAEGKMRSLNEIFGDLSTSLGKLTQQERLQAISDLFNTRDTASVKALLNAVNQDWNAIGESILNAQGAAEKMMDTQWDNLSGDIKRLQSAFSDLKIELSDKLSPSLRSAAQNATEFITAITTGLKTGDWSELKDVGSKIIENIKAGFLGEPLDISALLDKGIEYITNNLPSWLAAGEKLITNILDGASAHYEEAVQLGVEVVSKVASGIEQNLPAIITSFGNLLNKAISYAMENAPKLVEGGVQLVKNLGQGILDNAPAIIASIRTVISNARAEFFNHLPEILEWGIKLCGQIAAGIIKNIPEIISSFSKIHNEIRIDISNIDWSDLGRRIILAIAKGLLNAQGEIDRAIKELIAKIKGGFTIDWKPFGSRIPEHIAQGMYNNVKFITAAVQKIIEAIKSAFGLGWVDLGKGISVDIGKGIGGDSSAVNAINNLTNSMANALNGADFTSSGKGIGNKIAAGINESKNTALNAMNNLVAALQAKANEAQNAASGVNNILHARLNGSVGTAEMYGAAGDTMETEEEAIINLLEKYLPIIASRGNDYNQLNREFGWAIS